MSFIIGHSNGKCLSDYIAKDCTYDCTTNEEDAGGQSQSKSVITFSDVDLLVRWINGELATKPLDTNALVGGGNGDKDIEEITCTSTLDRPTESTACASHELNETNNIQVSLRHKQALDMMLSADLSKIIDTLPFRPKGGAHFVFSSGLDKQKKRRRESTWLQMEKQW